MKKHTKWIAVVLCCLLTFGTAAYAVEAYSRTITVDYMDIKLQIDGQPVTPKDAGGTVVEPFAYNGTTFLPVRAISEALGKKVDWNQQTKTVIIGDNPITGSWRAVKISFQGQNTPLSAFAGGSFAVRLDEGGTGAMTLGTEVHAVTWKEDNGALVIIDEEGSPMVGTVTNNVMVLNIEGSFVTLTR